MTALGTLLYTSLIAAVSPVLFLAVIALLVMRGRAPDERPGPAAFFMNGVALACIVVGVFAIGIAVHSVASLVGPAPNPSGSISSSSSSAIGQSSTGPITNFTNPDTSGSLPADEVSAVRNQYVSDAVTAGLFLVVSAIGFRLVWPRALQEAKRPEVANLALRYSFFVAGLAALALLIFVPLAADNVFRAIAPGVAGGPGHADGVRNLFTFGVVSALLAVIVQYHLRHGNQIRSEPIPPPSVPPPYVDGGDYFQQS